MNAIVNVKQYIDSNMSHELNLDLLSQHQFISKFHLLRLFKRYYGLSPRQYLLNKRFSYAKKLLFDGIAISEACYAAGFTSPASFSTLFKNTFGYTPGEFQKRAIFTKSSRC
ncbi:AraC family transcriptional regulator [Niabella yanshanensis]|uniref:AraC family transcriptional regulator n=1 Tax=Niabella yanshanensis TaxID=577386 RepID=A0ABZ0W679_9BACT|nr:AraC family transcriptional regulator [Niabella yanshanensis]WQD38783.1 AraC family transcriptional regulator [Niabella yanshanensis]